MSICCMAGGMCLTAWLETCPAASFTVVVHLLALIEGMRRHGITATAMLCRLGVSWRGGWATTQLPGPCFVPAFKCDFALLLLLLHQQALRPACVSPCRNTSWASPLACHLVWCADGFSWIAFVALRCHGRVLNTLRVQAKPANDACWNVWIQLEEDCERAETADALRAWRTEATQTLKLPDDFTTIPEVGRGVVWQTVRSCVAGCKLLRPAHRK